MSGRGSELERFRRALASNFLTVIPLLPLAGLWAVATRARRWFYTQGLFKSVRVNRPVVSVGNLAAGGAGKTPFVIFLAQYLINRGARVAVLSRGYGRDTRHRVVVRRPGEPVRAGESVAGDEPLMIAGALPGAAVVVDDDRSKAAKYAVDELGAEILLLDDGFQYLKLHKDLDLVLIDARRPPGLTIPAGIYRETTRALAHADLIVFTKCKATDYRDVWRRQLQYVGVRAPQVEVALVPAYLRPLNGTERLNLSVLEGAKVLAFAGIADFAAFVDDLRSLGAVVARQRPFTDHHRFTFSELADAEGTALVAGCDFLITTAKDEARLTTWRPAVQTYVLEQSVEVLSGYEVLNALLDDLIKRKDRGN